jgi:hypothetical protein
MKSKIWKQFSATDFFANLDIPEDWDSLEDFVDWYMGSKIPLIIPWNAEVIRSDDAVAICIFRKGNYQVEFYLEYPEMYIRKHAHPRMEVIVMDLGGGSITPKQTDIDVSRLWGRTYEKLNPGEYHGGDSSSLISGGFVTLAFQRWENPDEMTSAAIQWKGEIQGPLQSTLITKHYPNGLIQSNYADVSNGDKT